MPLNGGNLEKVLVVDDDRNVCTGLKRILQRAGYLVHIAEGGAAALAFAQDGKADLVVLDLLMPHLSGLETCRRLREQEGWEDVPVLILTGSREEDVYEEAMACGADDFLTKPVREEELLLRTKSLIRIQRLIENQRNMIRSIQEQNDWIIKNKSLHERIQAFLLHDLKNPLHRILLQAELMLDRGTAETGPWTQVLEGSEHLLRLVGSWMDHLRSDQVEHEPNLAEERMKPLLETVLGQNALWMKVRKLTGILDMEDPDLTFPVDAALILRVLGNLMDNCIRYAPEGGELRLGARRTGAGSLQILVSDQGPGVPVSSREHIFDLNVQLEASGHRLHSHQNRGLGLAFCKSAVEAHGGTIWVEDAPGGGAMFVVELPKWLKDGI